MAELNVENRTLFVGDNLPILQGFNSECIDLIYLDPPFNSGRNYAAPIGSAAEGAEFPDLHSLTPGERMALDRLIDQGEGPAAVISAAGKSVGASTEAYLYMMYERLVELRRVLKPHGSIYLHCDDTEAAWLKALMDAIFGRDMFINEIVWQRTYAHGDKNSFGRIADHILFYGRSPINAAAAASALDEEYIRKNYRQDDGDGRGPYQTVVLTAPSPGAGESGQPWRGYDPTTIGRHWAVPKARERGEYGDWIAANIINGYEQIDGVHERLDALSDHQMIYWTKNRTPRIKRYLAATNGQVPGSIWSDIGPVSSQSHERTGYPTQKPLALLHRIIRASSKPGDVVLDPFCGCATTCVAAELSGRQWIGIDRSARAYDLVVSRLEKEVALGDRPITRGQVHRRTEAPDRTEMLTLRRSPDIKEIRYREQKGICPGHSGYTPFPFMQVDHIHPQSKGGADVDENLQLLCITCNNVKGTGTMAEMYERLARIREQGLGHWSPLNSEFAPSDDEE